MPMWAAFIIGTSFAPSPIANVILPNCYRTIFTIPAFYPGSNLQHTTESQNNDSFASLLLSSLLCRMGGRSGPSMSSPILLSSDYPSIFSTNLSSYLPMDTRSSRSLQTYWCMEKSGWNRLQLFAIFSAVSSLSPVSIHTLISKWGREYLLGWDLWWFQGLHPEDDPEQLLRQLYRDQSRVHWLFLLSITHYPLELTAIYAYSSHIIIRIWVSLRWARSSALFLKRYWAHYRDWMFDSWPIWTWWYYQPPSNRGRSSHYAGLSQTSSFYQN